MKFWLWYMRAAGLYCIVLVVQGFILGEYLGAIFIGFLAATDTIGPIKPGGIFMLIAGDLAGIGTVTAGTGDILRIANSSGGTAKYQIAILARSA